MPFITPDPKNSKASERHELRLTLASRGYTPLPADGKRILIPGWTKREDEKGRTVGGPAWLEDFRRSNRFPNTGLRCDGLAAVDIDIDEEGDGPLTAEVTELVDPDQKGLLRARQGSTKTLILFRYTGEGRKRWSSRRTLPSGKVAQVEILCGPGCQFIAHGMHPDGTAYQWVEGGPWDVDLADLPELTDEHIDDILADVEDVFDEAGLPKQVDHREGGGYEVVRKLTRDMVFSIVPEFGARAAVGQMTVREMERAVDEVGGVLFCHADGIRPDSDGGRAVAQTGRDGGFVIVDHPAQTVWALAEEALDAPASDGLADALEDAEDEPVLPVDPEKSPEVSRMRAGAKLDGSIYVMEGKRFFRPGNPGRSLTYPEMATIYGKGALDNWIASHLATRVAEHVVWDPEQPAESIVTDPVTGEAAYNTFAMPRWDEVTPDHAILAVWDAFMEHLIPDPESREVFLDWLAAKVQKPAQRGFGVVMVAEKQGTGRGALTEILEGLFGYWNVDAASITRVLGRGQYNDIGKNRLFVVLSEASASEAGERTSGYDAKRRAYEALKETIDPRNVRQRMNSKWGTDETVRAYSSWLIATNHADALPVDDRDRRLYVLENGDELSPEMGRALDRFCKNRRALAALWERMMAREAEVQVMAPAPKTEAKAKMIEWSKSDVDHCLEAFFQEMAHHGIEACHPNQFDRWVELWVEETGTHFPHPRAPALAFKRKTVSTRPMKVSGLGYRTAFRARAWGEFGRSKDGWESLRFSIASHVGKLESTLRATDYIPGNDGTPDA